MSERKGTGIDSMDGRQLRHDRDVLRMVGLGVIAFGLWSVVRVFMYIAIEKSQIYDLIKNAEKTIDEITEENADFVNTLVYFLFIAIIMIATLCDILVRLYVGRCAIAEAKGLRRGNAYLVIAGFMALLSLLMMVSALTGLKPDADVILDRLSTLLVELTSFITLIELFAAVYRIRR
jgi:uncharacterized membrane protein